MNIMLTNSLFRYYRDLKTHGKHCIFHNEVKYIDVNQSLFIVRV